jgi:mono/diheme cytochrome c family protein
MQISVRQSQKLFHANVPAGRTCGSLDDCLSQPSVRSHRHFFNEHGDRMRRVLIAGLALAALVSQASAQVTGDARKGEVLALTVCSQCHAVRPGQLRSPNPMAPNFTSIATTLGMTDRALRVWLQSSHPTMPNVVLTSDERDDVIAYILGQKTGI